MEEVLLMGQNYYRGIKSVKFVPRKMVPFELANHSGDTFSLKFLGITLFKKTYKENLYWYGTVKRTLKEIADTSRYFFIENEAIYKMAYVCIYGEHGSETKHFYTNEEAMKFLQEFKAKCEKSGNLLS